MANITVCNGDLPAGVVFQTVAVDTETMGLNLWRDRLCLVQLSDEKENVYLVKIIPDCDCPHLKALLSDKNVLKIFHFARFDVAKILHDLGVMTAPVYCTKIASKLVRTNAPSHSLKSLCKDLLGIELNKEQQTSDWGASTLNAEQQSYAAADVLYLHKLKAVLDTLLLREKRADLAQDCFDFLSTRARLDLLDFDDPDIFQH